MSRLDEQVQQALEKYGDDIDEILETLKKQAMGVTFALVPGLRDKPKNATLAAIGLEVELKPDGSPRCCGSCKQPILIQPPAVWEVYKTRPDIRALEGMLEHIAGRAKQRAAEKIDPVIIVQFGDIDSTEQTSEERVSVVKDMGEVKNELNGSPDRTPEPKVKLGL